MTISIVDDRGRKLVFTRPPTRVVSLVPSDTCSVAALGATHLLVGRTDYCVEPASLAQHIPSVGGTKNPRIDDIVALAPDVVLANQEENSRGDIEALSARGIPVLIAFPTTVSQGIAGIARLARLLGLERSETARDLIRRGYDMLRRAEAHRQNTRPLRAFVPIWMSPLMTIHGDTFISDMLDLAGAHNVFADRPRRYPLAADLGRAVPISPETLGDRDTRYPRITHDELVARAPDIVLLPDEPHPFTDADAEVFRALPLPASKHGTIVRCQGADLCWHGARSIEGFDRLASLIAELGPRVPQVPS